MTAFAFFGALEAGFIFGLVALGVYLSFRVLHFPDLTVDGSFPLGACVAVILIVGGMDPFLATAIAAAAGFLAGMTTALLHTGLKVIHLLAGILVMLALYSVNLRIMGRPNTPLLGEATVFSALEALPLPAYIVLPAALFVLTGLAKLLLDWFLHTEAGLAIRAVGANPRMAAANGIDRNRAIVVGMGLSNAYVALAGALFAQTQGVADVSMGLGVIIIGLAAVIIGETILPARGILLATLAVVLGAVFYRLAIALALNLDAIGLKAQDLNLITAAVVVAAIALSRLRKGARASADRMEGGQAFKLTSDERAG